MSDTYCGGYKKALLDIYTMVDKYSDIAKSKRAYKNFVRNFIMFVLQHPAALDEFMSMTFIDVSVTKDGDIIDYNRKYECFS